MPDFKIETTYHLPIFRHRTYAAENPEEACRLALEDDNWDIAKKDYASSGDFHVTGVWDGPHAAYSGPPIPVPTQSHEQVQRRARHFEILLGLLKILFDDVHAARHPSFDWLAKAAWAIARGEAILAGDQDPEEPADPPEPSHDLARLQKDRARDTVSSVLDGRSFEGLAPDAVTDDEIHAACLAIAATIDFSDKVGSAEFQAALSVIRAAYPRLAPD